MKENEKTLETVIKKNQEITDEEDLIRHNLKEIVDLGTYLGEEAELDTKRRLMHNSQSIRENVNEASNLIDRGGAEGQLSDELVEQDAHRVDI